MLENLTTIIQNPALDLLHACKTKQPSDPCVKCLSLVSVYSLLQYISAGFFEYSLKIKWTLNIRPQMEAYYHFSSVSALIVDACKNHLTLSFSVKVLFLDLGYETIF